MYFVFARGPLKSQEGAHEVFRETALVSNYLQMEMPSGRHSGDRLYKGIQMESMKRSKQQRRLPFGEDAIDSRQAAALTLDDLAKILAYFSHDLFAFNFLHAFCKICFLMFS
jgi:hypothetical protein